MDMGFYAVLGPAVRPGARLDPVRATRVDFLKDSVGQAGAIGAVIGVVVLVVALLVLMTLAVVRLSNAHGPAPRRRDPHHPGARHRLDHLLRRWACSSAGVPFASKGTAAARPGPRAPGARRAARTRRSFAKQAAVDAFRDTPPDQLLTGLRGKDVIFTFIESYGRGGDRGPGDGTAGRRGARRRGRERLDAAGFASRSAFLTSPTSGAGSWLAHSTFMSGLWVNNQQRYRHAHLERPR